MLTGYYVSVDFRILSCEKQAENILYAQKNP